MICNNIVTSSPYWYREPDKNELTTTWIGGSQKNHPLYLLYRWFLGLFSVCALIHTLVETVLVNYGTETHMNIYKYPVYLTHWTRINAAISLFLEAILVTLSFRRDDLHSYSLTPERQGLPIFHRVVWTLSTITVPVSIIVTMVYWVKLHDPKIHMVDFENIFSHLLVCVIAVVDLFISRKPWAIKHAYKAIVFCCFYLVFNLIYYFSGGTNNQGLPYVYTITDWSKPGKVILVLIAVSLAIVIFQCLIALLVRLRGIVENKFSRGASELAVAKDEDKQRIDSGNNNI